MHNLKFLSIIILMLFISCDAKTPSVSPSKQAQFQEEQSQKLHKIADEEYSIVEIEGCEYIIFKDHLKANQGYGFMAHKGNCKNPIHCYNSLNTKADSLNVSQ